MRTLGQARGSSKRGALGTRSRLVVSLGLLLAVGAATAWPQGHVMAAVLRAMPPSLLGSSPGYLGVELADVDAGRMQALKLKEQRGAVIVLIDHDAPAGQIGLRVNDVVLEFNGKPVENAVQLREILKALPAGHKVNLVIVRDGSPLTLHTEMADRKKVEHEAWNKIGDDGEANSGHSMWFWNNHASDTHSAGSFHLPFFGSVNVGVALEPLTAQMAEVLGVQKGVMIKQVTRRSAASAAGLKALDVILKVGNDPIGSLSGWDRALRANEGRTVPVTILRDRKPQTVTMSVDSKRHN
jgi:serine protease Do